jgi:hypothetical protein
MGKYPTRFRLGCRYSCIYPGFTPDFKEFQAVAGNSYAIGSPIQEINGGVAEG